MKRKSIVLGIAATALIIGVAAYNAAPVFAHGNEGSGGQMGQGYSQGMMGNQGQQMMGQGQGYDQQMMGQGYGHPMMGNQGHAQGYGMMGQGHGMMMGFGYTNSGVDRNLSVDDVKGMLESRLKMHDNDRLKIGKVEASGENTIIAEIVTVDDSLVQKIEFDTKTGAHHPVK